MKTNTFPLWRFFLILPAVAIGYFAGQAGIVTRVVQAEVRETPQREAFQAGSERSETVLKEIAKTLKTMDSRLERLEKIAIEKNTR